jgi:hypothetical protein
VEGCAKVVVRGDQGDQVDRCADWCCGGGHEGGGEDLDRASDVVVMLFSFHQLSFILVSCFYCAHFVRGQKGLPHYSPPTQQQQKADTRLPHPHQ